MNNSRHKRPTQCQRIIKYLKDFGSITQLDALRDLGCMRLASRISELKQQGYQIASTYIHTTNRYGEPIKYKEYYLQ